MSYMCDCSTFHVFDSTASSQRKRARCFIGAGETSDGGERNSSFYGENADRQRVIQRLCCFHDRQAKRLHSDKSIGRHSAQIGITLERRANDLSHTESAAWIRSSYATNDN